MAASEMPLASMTGLPHTLGSFMFAQDSPLYATEKPYQVVGTLPPEQEHMRSNLTFEERDQIPVYDLRNVALSLSLDLHGIEIVEQVGLSAFDLGNETDLKAYLDQVVQLLRQRLSAEIVIIYSYNVSTPVGPIGPELMRCPVSEGWDGTRT
jgi:hypothetical protein